MIRNIFFSVVLFLGFYFLSGCITFKYFPFDGEYQVARVVDGDTFDVDFSLDDAIDSSDERCRLVGCDTPETGGRKGIQYWGPEAKAFMVSRLEGRYVYLEFQTPKRDSFGRLLVRVWTRDGTFINKYLVESGYARAWYQDKYPEKDYFMGLESYARRMYMGLWSEFQP